MKIVLYENIFTFIYEKALYKLTLHLGTISYIPTRQKLRNLTIHETVEELLYTMRKMQNGTNLDRIQFGSF